MRQNMLLLVVTKGTNMKLDSCGATFVPLDVETTKRRTHAVKSTHAIRVDYGLPPGIPKRVLSNPAKPT